MEQVRPNLLSRGKLSVEPLEEHLITVRKTLTAPAGQLYFFSVYLALLYQGPLF